MIAPRIIGSATNVIFDGVLGKELPKGRTLNQAEAYLQPGGHGQIAQLPQGTSAVPGRLMDLNQLGMLLGLTALLYLAGAAFSWGQCHIMAEVAQRTIFGMRRDLEAKLTRLPPRYFYSHRRGDVLSRGTNDIDNLTTTVQPGLGQLLTIARAFLADPPP